MEEEITESEQENKQIDYNFYLEASEVKNF